MITPMVSGRIVKDAEIRAAGQTQVCSFSVAAETGYGDKKQTHFYECSYWGNAGAGIQPYLKKGMPVTVVGEYSEREYNGKQYKQLRVYNIDMQGSSQQNQQQSGYQAPAQQQSYNNNQQNNQRPAPTQHNPAMNGSAPVDDDIPFSRHFDGQF